MDERSPNCEEARDKMGLLIASDALLTEIQGVREHLSSCADCRGYFDKLRGDDDELAEFTAAYRPRIEALKTRTLHALPDPPVALRVSVRWWQRIFDIPPRRTAAVAAVLAILLMIFFPRGPRESFDAWAEVIQTVRQATSARFRIRSMNGGRVDSSQIYTARGTAHRTYEDGELVEALFVDFDLGQLMYFAYPLKMVARMTMDEKMEESFRQHDPARTFNFLQEYEYEELGRSRIDGRWAAGIRITDARFLAQRLDHAELELWVDPETKLPIRFDVEGDVAGSSNSKHVRFYDFRWNEQVDEAEFDPDIPEEFEQVEGGHLQVDEEHLLQGLRLFADVVDRYPTTLAYESLKVELWRHFDGDRRDVARQVVRMFQIRLASDFFGERIKGGSEVVYFGSMVEPGERSRVLMRWKESEDHYRVIFGDLRAETVTGQELLALEGER